MIRNLFIIRHGIPLVRLDFGECYSLGVNDDLIAGLMGALDSFCHELTGTSIRSLNFANYIFYFYKDISIPSNLFVFIADSDEEPWTVNFKIHRIAQIFTEKYSEIIRAFNGNVNQFKDFNSILVDMNLAPKNCGGRPECDGCPNSIKTNEILNAFNEDKKGFLDRFTGLFKRSKVIVESY